MPAEYDRPEYRGRGKQGRQPDVLAAASTRAARRPGAWGRVPVEGLPELRALFAAELGGGIGAHEVLVAPGGQAALSAAFRALARPGDRILVESPTYLGAIAADFLGVTQHRR